MAKYDVRVRYAFEGTYKVVAEDRDEAERIVTEDCGLILGGNIHTTRDDDEVTDWRFSSHPDMQILSFRERVGKGKVRYTSMCFSDRIEELRKDIIEAIRQLLDAHGEEAEEGIGSDHYCSGIGDRFAVYFGERIRAVRTVYDSVSGNRI